MRSPTPPPLGCSQPVHINPQTRCSHLDPDLVCFSVHQSMEGQTCLITPSPELITVGTTDSTENYHVDSSGQHLVLSLNSRAFLLSSRRAQNPCWPPLLQDVPNAKHESKFSGFCVAPLLLAWRSLMQDRRGRASGTASKSDVVWSSLCLFILFSLLSHFPLVSVDASSERAHTPTLSTAGPLSLRLFWFWFRSWCTQVPGEPLGPSSCLLSCPALLPPPGSPMVLTRGLLSKGKPSLLSLP